ncbi:MAG: hypothetical protein KIT34_16595 [Cyanobacteria bacterium TGS_CYA1]|nr:hypothetical protein [Cyanobacteria bacterium TGS_CYA1]
MFEINVAIIAGLALALGVAILTFKSEMKKLPAFRSPLLKPALLAVAAFLAFKADQHVSAVLLFVLGAFYALKIDGFNFLGLVYTARALPHIILKQNRKLVEICDLALQKDCRAPILFAMGANSALELQEFDKCLNYSNRIILLLADKPNGYYLRGMAQFYLKNFETSLNDLNKAIALDPAQEAAYKFERARIKYLMKNYEDALLDVTNFTASPLYAGRNKYLADAFKAQTLHCLCRSDEALSLIENTLAFGKQVSIDEYNQFIAIQIEILVSLGKWQDLIEVTSKEIVSQPFSYLFIFRALAYSCLGEIEKAEADLNTQDSPNYSSPDWQPVALAVKAYICLKRNLLADALAVAKQALDLNSELRLPQLMYAYCLIKNEKSADAKVLIDDLLKLAPNDGDANQLLSLIYEISGEEKKKLDCLVLVKKYGHSSLFD